MSGILKDVVVLSPSNNTAGTFSPSEDQAWVLTPCSSYDGSQIAVLAYTWGNAIRWLRCVNCKKPHVQNYGRVYPGVMPLAELAGACSQRRWPPGRESDKRQ